MGLRPSKRFNHYFVKKNFRPLAVTGQVEILSWKDIGIKNLGAISSKTNTSTN